jgi:hypothetical protein
MDPREISHLSIEEKKARFRQVTTNVCSSRDTSSLPNP